MRRRARKQEKNIYEIKKPMNRFARYCYKLLAYAIMALTLKANAQCITEDTSQSIDFLHNCRVNYTIVLLSCDTCVPVRTLGYRVRLVVSDSDALTLNSIRNSCWMSLLRDTNFDFSANLALYQLFNRNSSIFLVFNDIHSWRRKLKQAELIYWQSVLRDDDE
jgi:hypothetical protein